MGANHHGRQDTRADARFGAIRRMVDSLQDRSAEHPFGASALHTTYTRLPILPAVPESQYRDGGLREFVAQFVIANDETPHVARREFC
jgi:hypothetical protein